MDPAEQARFDNRLEVMMQAMHLHGLRDKTIDSYRRTLYRIAGHFGRCPDDLAPDELKEYFSAMLEQYSWSTIKVDLSSLQFFHRYVLEREMGWIKIIRPPRVRTLPDIPTREEVQLLINTVRKLRYRIFLLVVYSLGLRITEGLALEVADIDGTQRRVHIRDGKGGKDRYVPLPGLTLQALRRFWSSHRHPRLLFPSPAGSQFIVRIASSPMDASGVQAALRAARLDCGTGAHAVLHTHSRRLDFHPHVHLIVPAGAIHQQQSAPVQGGGRQRTWQWKERGYLFPAANLAKVFRGKWLDGMRRAGLHVQATLPRDWVVHCQSVGSGHKALVYLGRHLYRGVLPEKDILSDRDGLITFRIRDNSGAVLIQSLPGAEFLWMLLRHVLPKRFRRARDYGLLHGNSQKLLQMVQLLLRVVLPVPWQPQPKPPILCPHCGGVMAIIAVRVREIKPAPA